MKKNIDPDTRLTTKCIVLFILYKIDTDKTAEGIPTTMKNTRKIGNTFTVSAMHLFSPNIYNTASDSINIIVCFLFRNKYVIQ